MFKDITKEVFEKGWKMITTDTIPDNAILCFVERVQGIWKSDENGKEIESNPILRLYFTTIPMNVQWGDDWDEYNAEIPYDFYFEGKEMHEYDIYQIDITFDRDNAPVLPWDNYCNIPYYSVAEINSGKHAWIYFEGSHKRCNGLSIHAGENFFDIMPKIAKHIR